MDPANKQLERMALSIREAMTAEDRAVEDIRKARLGFLHQVATRNHARAVARGPMRPGALRLGIAFAVAATAAVSLWTWRQRPISFRSDSATVSNVPGDLIEASPHSVPLQFSEGSTVTLHQGGQMRVIGTNAAGARVLVENGTVDVSIAHRRAGRTRWSFEAGAFHVAVTGTRFRLAFQPQNQQFRLDMQEGRVVVSGGCLVAPTAVVAGDTLDLLCRPSDPAAVAQDDTAMGSAVPPDSQGRAGDGAGRQEHRPGHAGSAWRELLASGRLAEGLRAAERLGFEQICEVAMSKELLELADAARLFGRTPRAVLALQTLRRRFPGSADAATAAFSLGRIAFERSRAYVDAATWFDTYLREQPSGPLMGDAFGRLMEARHRSGDLTGARAEAQQYLHRFPRGPYASEARGILSK